MNKARKLRENEEKLIIECVEKLAETRVLQAMRGNILDRTQQLENFCKQFRNQEFQTTKNVKIN
ncbi:MAG: hypothetical protein NC177_12870 [Ruminococcus flavefaciens]|nr:hypothetical protein [Ruminococcus flavefaciens]